MHRQSEKKLVKQQYLLHMSSYYGELRPTSGWDLLASLGDPCKFQRVSRFGSVTARHSVVGVSQTVRRWTEGANYIRQGGHHVGHWPTFLVEIWIIATLCVLKEGCFVLAIFGQISFDVRMRGKESRASFYSRWKMQQKSPDHEPFRLAYKLFTFRPAVPSNFLLTMAVTQANDYFFTSR